MTFKTYLRHVDGRIEQSTRGLSPQNAIVNYAVLIGSREHIDQPWAAVLRNEMTRRTVLYSRFDRPEQRLQFGDAICVGEWMFDPDADADANARSIVAGRRHRPLSPGEVIDEMLCGFETDPADNEFQRGYHAALTDLRVRLITERN